MRGGRIHRRRVVVSHVRVHERPVGSGHQTVVYSGRCNLQLFSGIISGWAEDGGGWKS